MSRLPAFPALRPTIAACAVACAMLAGRPAGAQTATDAGAANAASQAAVAAGLKADWRAHLQRFEEGYFAANPSFAVSQGRHDYDGQLPDWSAAAIRQNIAWLEAQRARTAAFRPAALDQTQRFEREYLLARIDGDLFWLRDASQAFRNPAFYIGTLDPSVYLTRPYAPAVVRLKAFIAYANRLPRAARQIRDNLRGPLPRTYVELGINSFGGYASFFAHDVRPIFADVQDPALQAQLERALAAAAAAMQSLADAFKAQLPTANQDFALGATRFAQMLQATERVTTPLAELEAVGRRDLARNLAALKAACAQYLPDGDVHACLDRANRDKPADGPVEEARRQLLALRQFVVDHQLVSVPSDERALVNEAPAYNRSNSAYIDVPGPFDKGMPSVYYIAPPDPSWSPADQQAYIPAKADLLFTSVHEVWPGHFLQFLHSNRSPSAFGRLFVGYAFAEGWAHYTEEMMWDAGLGNGDPAVHIGQLGNALLRNVRFLCAIGLHTQGLSVPDCETMFREQAFQDPGNARQQAARGTYDPAYLNYTLGKLMIVKLREDWTATRGGRAAWQAFHDQFLSYGGPPIPLVRERMLGKADDGKLF
ncbi:DUF885 domain-containing protein [Solimonas variicoloris]|uniref:DUF885 domain-containing protein n=1 Tax=Solimonas variicoloris TaxID=254408 RepID=UPI00036DE3C0|nr:DUF885 domain-containing protein [Solimonas variicoloris]